MLIVAHLYFSWLIICVACKVITIDDFLTEEESDAIIAAGSSQGTAWGRSMAGDGVQASASWRNSLIDASLSLRHACQSAQLI